MLIGAIGRSVTTAALLVSTPCAALAAEPDRATIRWSAPSECPDERALRAEVERLLARSLDRPSGRIDVSGEVTRDPAAAGRYQMRLSIALGAGPSKERRLDGASCAMVTSAAAVIIALAIDAEPQPGPVPRTRPASPVPEVVPQEVKPPARRASIGRVWEIAAIEGVDFGSLPGVTAGLGLRAAVDLDADRVELQLATWLARRATLPSRSSTGTDLALHAAGARYCRWLTRRVIDLAPCAGLEGGVIVAAGFGGAPSSTGLGRWLAPQIGLLGVARPTPRFAVSIEVDGLALALRDRFTVLRGGEVYRPPPATLRLGLGAHLRFP